MLSWWTQQHSWTHPTSRRVRFTLLYLLLLLGSSSIVPPNRSRGFHVSRHLPIRPCRDVTAMSRSSFKSRLAEFSSATDTHGVKLTVTASRVRNVFWSLTLVASFTFLTYFFTVRVLHFLNYEVTSNVQLTTGTTPFPQITVCTDPENSINPTLMNTSDIVNARTLRFGYFPLRDSMFNVDKETRLKYFTNDTMTFLKRLATDFDLLHSDKAKSFFCPTEASDGFLGFFAVATDCASAHINPIFKMRLGEWNNWKVLIRTLTSHPLNEPVGSEGQVLDLGELYERAGLAIHDQVESAPIANGVLAGMGLYRRRIARNGVCFTVEKHESKYSDLKSVLLQVSPELSRPQKISMYPTKDRYVTVQVHADGDSINFPVSSYRLSARHELNITVTKVTHVVRQGPPYGDICGLDSSLRYMNNVKYTRGRCVEECITDMVLDVAHCRLHYLPGPTGVRLCNETDGIYSSKLSLNSGTERLMIENFITSRGEDRCLKSCPMPCDHWLYQTTVTSDLPRLPHGALLVVQDAPGTEMFELFELPLYPVEALLAELGGTMGLFVGISLLTIVHFLEFVFMEIFYFFSTPCHRTQKVVDQKATQSDDAVSVDINDLKEKEEDIGNTIRCLKSDVRCLKDLYHEMDVRVKEISLLQIK